MSETQETQATEQPQRTPMSDIEFALACNECESITEAAEATGLTPNTVRQRRTTVKARLEVVRQTLEANGKDASNVPVLKEYTRGGGTRGNNSLVSKRLISALGLEGEEAEAMTAKLAENMAASAESQPSENPQQGESSEQSE